LVEILVIRHKLRRTLNFAVFLESALHDWFSVLRPFIFLLLLLLNHFGDVFYFDVAVFEFTAELVQVGLLDREVSAAHVDYSHTGDAFGGLLLVHEEGFHVVDQLELHEVGLALDVHVDFDSIADLELAHHNALLTDRQIHFVLFLHKRHRIDAVLYVRHFGYLALVVLRTHQTVCQLEFIQKLLVDVEYFVEFFITALKLAVGE